MTDETKPTVFEAFSRVQGAVQAIEKKDRNKDQNFSFRGIDAVIDAVGPVLREHNVFVIPKALSSTAERYVTTRGTAMQNVTVHMEYTVYGPAGDSFTGATYGAAADSGDKAISKAQSVAYRVFLLQGLTIPTRAPDPDSSSHERSSESPAQVARDELIALIQRKGVSTKRAMVQFESDNDEDIRYCNDPNLIRGQIKHYIDLADAPQKSDGAGE